MGTYLVMKNNFRRSLNHKLLFMLALLLPIVLCLIAGSINTGKTSIRVGILEDLPNQLTEMEQEELSDILGKSEGIKYAFE